jgi:hypothetical protein
MISDKCRKIALAIGIAAMVIAVSAPAEADEYPDRTLVTGSDDAIYIVMNGKARWIPSPTIFETMGLDWNAVRTIPDADLSSLEKAPLLVSGSGEAIYKIDQGSRHRLRSEAVLEEMGLDTEGVFNLSDDRLEQIPEGAPIP